MKTGSFNFDEYLEKLHEEAGEKIDSGKGSVETTEKDGILLPGDTKKNFDWLKKEFQKGAVEVKVEVKGEGSSFKPGYDLQTDLKSVKDFKPGMYGDVKTTDSETPEPKSPKNKKEETPAEEKEPKGDNEQKADTKEKSKKDPGAQQMKIDLKKEKKDDK
jgi:hypothetical protein